jgi:hypothetical protein
MPKRIWKFPLKIDRLQTLTLPTPYKILSIQMQEDRPMMWVELDDEGAPTSIEISIYGTGWEVPNDPGQYIATIVLDSAGLVWHFYMRNPT